MKRKVRVTAAITKNRYGGYRVVMSNGVYCDCTNLEDAQRHADYINNEDSDYPQYMEVDAPSYDDSNEQPTPYYEKIDLSRIEAEKRRKVEAENNRKAKKSDDNYVFVVSCQLKGENDVVYLQGETNLTKINEKYGGGFITSKCENAKVFNTKASAQKFIDGISNCWITKRLFRSMKVVRKSKKTFKIC